jgi:hypothetical protein
MLKTPVAILIAVVTLLGGFYGGYRLGNGSQASAASSSSSGGSRAGNFAAGNFAALCATPSPGSSPAAQGRGGGRGATGTITYLGNGTLTVHNPACNTDVKVTFDPTVIVRKTVVGSVSDLQESQNVTIAGQRQPDGSIKATSITLVPAGSFRFGAGGSGGAGGAGAGASADG